jgi:SAM-dependent methyltransferase
MRQLGWEVEGVEISANAKPISDFKVYQEEFDEIPISEPHYDAITAWAVLEHVHDPLSYFKKAAELLKSGGVFVFLVTNFDSLSSRCLFLEDVPRHLYFFTQGTITRFLTKSGFDLLRADYSNKVYSMHPVNFLRYYLYRLFRRRRFEWRDTQLICDLLRQNNLQTSFMRGLKLSMSNPLYVVDRILMPLYERYQIIFKKYGIVTYVATRC